MKAEPEASECYECGHCAPWAGVVCPRCGGRMMTKYDQTAEANEWDYNHPIEDDDDAD